MLNIISVIFVVEAVVRIIVMGFYIGERTYLKDPFNILDFMIVIFSCLTWILEASVKDADISFIRGFRALRALRPLRVVSKNEGKYSIQIDFYNLSFLIYRYQNCGKLPP